MNRREVGFSGPALPQRAACFFQRSAFQGGRFPGRKKKARKRKGKRKASLALFSDSLSVRSSTSHAAHGTQSLFCSPFLPLFFPLLPVRARNGRRAELRARARGRWRVEGATFAGAKNENDEKYKGRTKTFFFLPSSLTRSLFPNKKTGPVALGRAPSRACR